MPPNINMMGPAFVQQGTNIFRSVENCILKHLPQRDIEELQILDFGCGVGRVALPFFFKYRRPSYCVDVDEASIAYLREVIPGANPLRTGFEPPLPFQARSFDCIYAISLWTHFPPDLSDAWLKETVRLLRPGGIALLTTHGYRALSSQRAKGNFANVTDDDLRREGMIFKPNSSPRGRLG
jgi:SAM-dependent methyltransferase